MWTNFLFFYKKVIILGIHEIFPRPKEFSERSNTFNISFSINALNKVIHNLVKNL